MDRMNKNSQTIDSRRLSVAPMLDWTDRYCRFFLRLLSRHTLLYTEMVTTGAIIHGDADRHLRFDAAEHPLALQLGGSDPAALARCARMGAEYGYDEINLNVGCPSDRVQSGRFGACLMAEPRLVADGVAAMRDAVDCEVTVKHRIGIDDLDSYGALTDFVGTVADAGCQVFVVHARKAWLQGLSPKENRDVPPLRYETVHRLKRDFPHLCVVINGGFKTLAQVETEVADLDGVMIGREVYSNPWLLSDVDRRLYGAAANPCATPHEAIEALLPFVERELAAGTPLVRITRHILGLFQGRPGAKAWRRHLSEHSHRPGADTRVLIDALAKVPS